MLPDRSHERRNTAPSVAPAWSPSCISSAISRAVLPRRGAHLMLTRKPAKAVQVAEHSPAEADQPSRCEHLGEILRQAAGDDGQAPYNEILGA